MSRKDTGSSAPTRLPQIPNSRSTPQPSSTGTLQLPIRPIGFLYTQPARTAKESIFSFFKPSNGAAKKRKGNAASNATADDDGDDDAALRPASASSNITSSRPQSRSGSVPSFETTQLTRSHWHDNDVIDRLKQVAREIGISIQVPQAKKVDMVAIKEEAAKNLDDLKLQLDRASGVAEAAGDKKPPARAAPSLRPEKVLEIEEEKLHRAKSYERELVQKRQQMERKLDELQKQSADFEKKTDPGEELQAAVLAVNKEGLLIKVRDLTSECERLEEEGSTCRHMQRRLEAFLSAERAMCDDVGKEIQQHDDDLVKLRERLRDSVKEITSSLHVDDMEHARLLIQETLVGYENMLKSRRQELQDLRNQAEAAKKRDDIYARIETSLLRMYDPSMPSPRRDATKHKLAEFERSFGLLMNKLGNFESDTIIEMYNTQMQGESVWKASVKNTTERVAALSKQRDDLRAELLMLRDKGYTVDTADDSDEQHCAFGALQLSKQLNTTTSPQPTIDITEGNVSSRPSTAQSRADSVFDLLQFKPVNSTMVELSVKKANMKSDKLLEVERVLAGLKSGVCSLVERLAAVNLLSPELRDLLQKGPPSVDIRDEDCCVVLDHFCATLQSLVIAFDYEMYAGVSPINGSPFERRFPPSSPGLRARKSSLAHLSGDITTGFESPGRRGSRRFSLSSSLGIEMQAPASPVINPWLGSAKVSASSILPPSEHTARSRRLTMEDENDRANEDLKKKDERRQQKKLMKGRSVAEQSKVGTMDSLHVIKKIVSEMPPAVLASAEEKLKSNPFNVRVDVNEIDARMEEVSKAEKSLNTRRRQQTTKNSDDSDNEDDDDGVVAKTPSPSSIGTNSRTPLDANGNPLPQQAFRMNLNGNEVEVMHTQFRVSEDHKLRALLKKQSAKAEEKLKIERGELETLSDMKASKKKPSKDVVPTSSNSPESPKARSATQPEKQ